MFNLFGLSLYFVVLPCVLMSLAFRKRIEYFLAVMLPFFALILYCFGIAGHLLYGYYGITATLALANVGLFFIFSRCILQKRVKRVTDALKTHVLTPGFAAFLLWSLFASVYSWGRIFTHWDEFSHWGRIVKIIHFYNCLPVCDPAVLKQIIFKTYPVGTAMVEYLFTRFHDPSVFSESVCIFAMQILTFSLLSIFFVRISWKAWHKFLFALPVIFLCCYRWNNWFFSGIYVDSVLGICMAACLSVFLSETYESYFRLSLICILLSFLILCKASGTGLALMVVGIIFACEVSSLYIHCSKMEKRGFHFPKTLFLLCPFVFALIHKISTAGFMAQFSLKNITVSDIVNKMFISPDSNVQTIMLNFFKGIFIDRCPVIPSLFLSDFQYPITTLTYFTVIALFVFIIFLLYRKKKLEPDKRIVVLFCLLFVYFFLYSFTLLVYYIFSFGLHDALNLAGFHRYMSTFMVAVSLVFLFVIHQSSMKKHSFLIFSVLLWFFLSVHHLPGIIIDCLLPNHQTVTDFIIARKIIQEYREDSKKIFILSDNQFWCRYCPDNFYFGPTCHATKLMSIPGVTKIPEPIRHYFKVFSQKDIADLCRTMDFCLIHKYYPFHSERYSSFFKDGTPEAMSLYRSNGRNFELLPLKQFVFDFSNVNLFQVAERHNIKNIFIQKIQRMMLMIGSRGGCTLVPNKIIPLSNGKAKEIIVETGITLGNSECSVMINGKCVGHCPLVRGKNRITILGDTIRDFALVFYSKKGAVVFLKKVTVLYP